MRLCRTAGLAGNKAILAAKVVLVVGRVSAALVALCLGLAFAQTPNANPPAPQQPQAQPQQQQPPARSPFEDVPEVKPDQAKPDQAQPDQPHRAHKHPNRLLSPLAPILSKASNSAATVAFRATHCSPGCIPSKATHTIPSNCGAILCCSGIRATLTMCGWK